ncbi:MAG: 30S ribosomal protein S20 [Patescibacteria group bacterium]
MPNIKSAQKALRQSRKRHSKNSSDKEKIKVLLRSLRITKSNPDILNEEFNKLQSVLDKASKNNIIHKNKVARLKSRIYKAAHAATHTAKTRKTQKP